MLKTILDNYVNGNHTDAKKQAARYSEERLRVYMVLNCGYSSGKAANIAAYLKGNGTLEACGPFGRV